MKRFLMSVVVCLALTLSAVAKPKHKLNEITAKEMAAPGAAAAAIAGVAIYLVLRHRRARSSQS